MTGALVTMEGEALLESIGCWRSISRGTGTSDSGRRSISKGISFWSRVSRGTTTMEGAASAEAPTTMEGVASAEAEAMEGL